MHPVGVYPPTRQVPLTHGVWHDIKFWEEALGHRFSCWMGVRAHMVGRSEMALDKSNFTAELFTDASGSWGTGGVFGFERFSQ